MKYHCFALLCSCPPLTNHSVPSIHALTLLCQNLDMCSGGANSISDDICLAVYPRGGGVIPMLKNYAVNFV